MNDICEIPSCDQPAAWLVEPGVSLCDGHGRPAGQPVCKFCGVRIVSLTNPAPSSAPHRATCERAA